MKCSQCAAPMDVISGSEFARCGYCGTSVRIQEAPTPAMSAGHARPKQVSGALFAAIGFVLTIAVAVVVTLSGRSDANTSAPPALPAVLGAVLSEPPRQFHAPVCLVDANGDGVSDPVGMLLTGGTTRQPTLLDGATGKVLWSGASLPSMPQLACLDERWFVLAGDDFQAEFHDARNLGAGVRVLLRDKLREVGMGKGCARVKTADNAIQGVQLPGGAALDCSAPLRAVHEEPPGLIGLTDKSTRLEHGGRTYTLQKRRTGSPVLSVTVEERDEELWSRELPYTAATFSSAIAAGGKSIALWGAKPGAQSRGVLIGLDEASGEQRYAVPSELMVSNNLGLFAFNGRYVVVQVWTSLHAYDPDTGKLAWKVGP